MTNQNVPEQITCLQVDPRKYAARQNHQTSCRPLAKQYMTTEHGQAARGGNAQVHTSPATVKVNVGNPAKFIIQTNFSSRAIASNSCTAVWLKTLATSSSNEADASCLNFLLRSFGSANDCFLPNPCQLKLHHHFSLFFFSKIHDLFTRKNVVKRKYR
ncbi:hypothetical protein L798_05008 [Zootermopsis nevadensis]|uniref:Uncharacterized protein n=1 Tax=Zootermopsis nevadensis TaxID=136037 RepID=A0A067RM93_ZOONE|nr:hypothetical protein L798_05008 [Zootermopsis nevadensis]